MGLGKFLFFGGTAAGAGSGAALLTILAVLVVLALLIAAAVAASGIVQVPILSNMFGTDRPADLGVIPDYGGFRGAVDAQGVHVDSPYSKLCLTCDVRYGDSRPMNVSLDSAEATAYFRAVNDEKGPLREAQIRFGDNDEVEVTGLLNVDFEGRHFDGPVYGKGIFKKASGTSVVIVLRSGRSGLMPVPRQYLDAAQNALEDRFNQQFASMPGLMIDELSVEGGKMRFKGDFPHDVSAP
jgi:hypothetical protein